MTEPEILEALAQIGLRGEPSKTGHWEWRRIFVIDPQGCSQGRFSLRNGRLENLKWYCRPEGRVVPDERWAWTWDLWVQHRVRLSHATWNVAVVRATALAKAERAAKQALRDANPLPDKVRADGSVTPRKRKPLQLNIRKHLAVLLNVDRAEPPTA